MTDKNKIIEIVWRGDKEFYTLPSRENHMGEGALPSNQYALCGEFEGAGISGTLSPNVGDDGNNDGRFVISWDEAPGELPEDFIGGGSEMTDIFIALAESAGLDPWHDDDYEILERTIVP